ncbi:Ig-like domain-containing protein [Marinilactibacillus sp. 15R]|uniref:Ig-like domain-containing protein n=1 Tax=Marinilactibacillus sp. 15R TaxID=1911586 RepID=UPI001E6131F2|nr:Ig-like domain-containing protein [Marinilactibacillus sp. 15R]
MVVGASETLSATVAPEDATNKNINYTSSDDSIATVTPKLGKVTGIAAGEVTITVTTEDGSFTAECLVTVTAAE